MNMNKTFMYFACLRRVSEHRAANLASAKHPSEARAATTRTAWDPMMATFIPGLNREFTVSSSGQI